MLDGKVVERMYKRRHPVGKKNSKKLVSALGDTKTEQARQIEGERE